MYQGSWSLQQSRSPHSWGSAAPLGGTKGNLVMHLQSTVASDEGNAQPVKGQVLMHAAARGAAGGSLALRLVLRGVWVPGTGQLHATAEPELVVKTPPKASGQPVTPGTTPSTSGGGRLLPLADVSRWELLQLPSLLVRQVLGPDVVDVTASQWRPSTRQRWGTRAGRLPVGAWGGVQSAECKFRVEGRLVRAVLTEEEPSPLLTAQPGERQQQLQRQLREQLQILHHQQIHEQHSLLVQQHRQWQQLQEQQLHQHQQWHEQLQTQLMILQQQRQQQLHFELVPQQLIMDQLQHFKQPLVLHPKQLLLRLQPAAVPAPQQDGGRQVVPAVVAAAVAAAQRHGAEYTIPPPLTKDARRQLVGHQRQQSWSRGLQGLPQPARPVTASGEGGGNAVSAYQGEPRPLQLHGRLVSDNCNLSWALAADESSQVHKSPSSAAGHAMDATGSVLLDAGYRHALQYSLAAVVAVLVQLLLSAWQMVVLASPAVSARVSLMTMSLQAVLDAYMCLMHLVAAMLLSPPLTHVLAAASLLQLVLFAGYEARAVMQVWHAQSAMARQLTARGLWHSSSVDSSTGSMSGSRVALLLQVLVGTGATVRAGGASAGSSATSADSAASTGAINAGVRGTAVLSSAAMAVNVDDSDEARQLRHEVWLLYARSYGLLVAGILLAYQLHQHTELLLLLCYSFWLPQVVHSAAEDARQPLAPAYVLGMSVARLLLPLYLLAAPHGVLHLSPQPRLAAALCTWVAVQALALVAQHRWGPRCFVPSRLLPVRYNYFRPAAPRGSAACMCPACIATATKLHSDSSSSSSPGRNRNCGIESASYTGAACGISTPGGSSSDGGGGSFCMLGSTCSCVRCTWSTPVAASAWFAAADLTDAAATGSDARSTASACATPACTCYSGTAAGVPCSVHPGPTADPKPEAEDSARFVECVICLAPVAFTPPCARMVTPCGHFFHTGCLVRWMDVQLACPTCRGPLPPV